LRIGGALARVRAFNNTGHKGRLTFLPGKRRKVCRTGIVFLLWEKDQVRKIYCILAALCSVMVLPAQAQQSGAFMTGARLLGLCKTDNPYCTAYVAAVADTLAPLSEPGGPLPSNSLASVCPKQITVKQAIAAFQKFAQANPEGLQINAAQFVGDALHAAYPCASN
jgi:hypothetical protein